MIRIFFTLLLLALPVTLSAQELTLPPVDEAEEDESFVAYRERLIAAVVARDIEAIVAMSAEDIRLSFGGASGHAALREYLTVDPKTFPEGQRHEAPALRQRNWADLETVLRMGGVFDGDGQFVAPYTWSFQPPDDMDPFEVMFVTGTGVAMRDRPIRYGNVTAWLDHDVVRHLDWVSGTPYVKVARADETEGYVHRDYLRALVDYRAYFEKREGEWKMITFIAGD
ncbi:hypothetical protein [Roseovarius indicus]|uniref:hypothetical protein n=1 Tax=Roseovarius indicus TaxID=540747 RepID=UPI0007D9E714|nr:hypothetical protein [Roseovarius indicus]OAO09520.1 hypothetical protein A8B76_22585 [Roseovarius indicus]